jgi:5-methylcytosine-specific restriction enzyme A
MPTIVLQKRKEIGVTYNKKALQGFYQDKRWKRLRRLKFKENPLCERCLPKGIIRQTEEIHHKIHIDLQHPDESLIFDFDNLESLCKECHVAEHYPSTMNPIERQIAERREVR